MRKLAFMVLAALVVVGGNGLFGQSATQNVNITVNLSAWYDLSIGSNALTFNDVAPAITNPPANVSIPATQNPVTVRAFAIMVPADSLHLEVIANQNLTKAGGVTIGIGAISWTATGAGYSAGTMSLATVQTGLWSGSVFHWHEGTFSYNFARDYVNQEPGTYTATATYTLSAV